MASALFLDRDGVINHDAGYACSIEAFRFVDGIFALVRGVLALGRRVVVVTNQAGIGRGYYTPDDFARLTAWMRDRFAEHGAPLTAVYHCPYHPEGIPPWRGDAPCRKPRPGMLLEAAADLGLDLGASVLIGDHETDIAAGRAAGLKANGFFDPTGAQPRVAADAVLRDHGESLAWVQAMTPCHVGSR